MTDRSLNEMSDEKLAEHHQDVLLRLESLDAAARASMAGLTQAEYDERLTLMRRNAEIEDEELNRRDQRPLDVATAFQEETPDLLKVLESGNAVALVKYLLDQTDATLALLVDKAATVAEISEGVLRFRAMDDEGHVVQQESP